MLKRVTFDCSDDGHLEALCAYLRGQGVAFSVEDVTEKVGSGTGPAPGPTA